MKAAKTGYVFTMVTLLTMTIVLAIAAFYPAPKRYTAPSYPRSAGFDTNSLMYQQQQRQYEQDSKLYEENNKTVDEQRQVWGQRVFIICLSMGGVLLAIGMWQTNMAPMLSTSMLFASFILMVFGSGLASYYADSTSIALFGSSSKVDLTGYKQLQFAIALVGAVVGAALELSGLLKKENEGDSRS